MVPEGPKMAPKTLLGLLWPILACFFCPGPKIFLSPFWPKLGQFFFKFFYYYLASQRVWDAQKPKIDPVDPPMDPFWPSWWAFWPKLGSKDAFFRNKQFWLQVMLFRFPDGLWPSKNQISVSTPPIGTILACSGTSGRHATRLVSHMRAQHYLNPS